MTQKNALSVQSLACHGKCSLSEALPIISSFGISVSVLPTVLLSTHTGGFGKPQKLDTTEFFGNTMEHFKEQNISFDGIQTGYFSDKSQIELFRKNLSFLKKQKGILLVDPVLGDKGSLFKGLSEDLFEEMLKLCQIADVITPNLTEAYLLSGTEYTENPTDEDIIDLCLNLYDKTKAQVIITGIERNKKIATVIYNGEKIKYIYCKRINKHFHGAGDIFSSYLFALLLKGKKLEKAAKKSTKFILKAIKNTIKQKSDEKNGISFEGLM